VVNSKRKGNNGEREFARLCCSEGYTVRRGQQYDGIEGEDVIGLPFTHVEVKRVERLNIGEAMRQSIRDSRFSGKMPIVAHRKNNENWLITLTAEDFFKLFREWEAGQCSG